MIPVVACVDLDRTLIYSTGALALRMSDHDAPRLVCVEIYQGRPLAFITEQAAELLRQLPEDLLLVPTTTRTVEQLTRVHLPMPTPQYAIAANGGVILQGGVVDEDWGAEIDRRLAQAAPLEEIVHHLGRWAHDPFMLSQRTASDLFAYCVVDRQALPLSLVEDLTGWLGERGWRVSLQGRKLYAVPQGLTKSAAAQEVARRIGADGYVAAGDSLLDAELLEAATEAAVPVAGELADTGWTTPGLHRLAQPGVLGGEELITWLSSRTQRNLSRAATR